MNKTEIKAALKTNAAKAIQNRKDYFAGQPHQYDYDYRDHDLRIETRALHIALAYLNYKQFKSAEKYNYSTDDKALMKLSEDVFVDRAGDQNVAVRRAKEILGMTMEVQIGKLTRRAIVPDEHFDNWVNGKPRPVTVPAVAA